MEEEKLHHPDEARLWLTMVVNSAFANAYLLNARPSDDPLVRRFTTLAFSASGSNAALMRELALFNRLSQMLLAIEPEGASALALAQTRAAFRLLGLDCASTRSG